MGRWTVGLMALASWALVCPACGGSDEDPIETLGGSGGKAGSGGKGGSGGAKADGGGSGGSDAAPDATGGSAGDGAAGDAGSDAAGGGSGGTAGSDGGSDAPSDGSGGACPDPLNEPNENEQAAFGLGAVDDCDATKEQSAILSNGDSDWFKYAGSDNLIACSPNAKVVVDDSTMRVCVFVECQGGQTTNVSCNSGTATQSPAGRAGCCATGIAADAKVTCSGLTGANADLYVRVDHPSGPICKTYKLTYSY